MNKTLHISALLTFLAFMVMRIAPYYEGLAFDKFWFLPLGLLPLTLVLLLTFLILSIVVLISVLRKRIAAKNLIVLAVLPAAIFLVYRLPFPTYVDGMRDTVSRAVSREEFIALARDARVSSPDWVKNREGHDEIVVSLKAKHSKPLGLSAIPPRIKVSENYVSVFYGSALVKHWGYVVGDIKEFPIEHIPEDMYKKVYEGVWVYHDIW